MWYTRHEGVEPSLKEDFDDANSKAYPRQFKKILMIPIVKHIQDNSRRFWFQERSVFMDNSSKHQAIQDIQVRLTR